MNFLSPRSLLPSIKTTNKYINVFVPKKLQPYLYRWSRHEQVITSKFFQQEQAVPLLFVIIFFSVRLPVSEATGKWLLYCIFHLLSASLITVKVSLIFHFARLLVLCNLRCAIKTSFLLSKRDQQLFVISLLVQLLQVVTFFNLSLDILEYCSLAHFIWNRLRLGSERIEHRFIITF